jgi:hypothetical protein
MQRSGAFAHQRAFQGLIETLVAHSVKPVLGTVGSAYMDALDIIEPAGIRYIGCTRGRTAWWTGWFSAYTVWLYRQRPWPIIETKPQ